MSKSKFLGHSVLISRSERFSSFDMEFSVGVICEWEVLFIGCGVEDTDIFFFFSLALSVAG